MLLIWVTPAHNESSRLSPNTHKCKSRLANDVKEFIEDLDLAEEDQIKVISLSLKKLGMYDKIDKFLCKPPAKGRKLTPTTTRSATWEPWHANSTLSTITSRPVLFQGTEKSKIHAGLDYVATITIISKRNQNFYQSHWYIMNNTVKELYRKYITKNPTLTVSYGTFLVLKPFYVKSAITKDMETSLC